MSVKSTLVKKTLTLALNGGTTSSGAVKYVNRTFNNINPDATDIGLHATAVVLEGLLANSLENVYSNEKNLLAEEA